MAHYSIKRKDVSMAMAKDDGYVIFNTITGETLTRYSVDAAAIPGAFARHDDLIAVKDPVRAQQLAHAMNSGERLPAPGERKYCSGGGYYFGTCNCFYCREN
jgi:hypothetical protein